MTDALDADLRRLAATPRLLVVSDFDGTLAPFVDDPAAARGEPAGIRALEALAALPETVAALVSGRAFSSLAAVSGRPAGVRLVGSHGAEFGRGADPLTAAERDLFARLADGAAEITEGTPGAHVERKPTGIVVHVRPVADPAARARLLDAARERLATLPGVTATAGKDVLELAVREAGKGVAIAALRDETAATATLFAGDDVTDERGFAALGPGDLGIKVGDGDTAAGRRVAGIDDVCRALARLAALRAESAADA